MVDSEIDWGKLSSDSDGDESEPELEVVVPVVGEQPAVQSKETNEAVPEPQHKGEKGHPNIVPFKESKHIRPKMKIKGGFRPEKLEKKKNTIRKAVQSILDFRSTHSTLAETPTVTTRCTRHHPKVNSKLRATNRLRKSLRLLNNKLSRLRLSRRTLNNNQCVSSSRRRRRKKMRLSSKRKLN